MPTVELVIDDQLAALPGPEKIKVLLTLRFSTIGRWARCHGWFPEHVYMTLSGARPGIGVRNALAADLGLTRDEVDRLIDEAESAAAKAS